MSQLHIYPWEPGSPGKGVVYADGTVAHWLVDAVEGHPHHEPALAALNRDLASVAVFYRLTRDGSVTFLPDPPDRAARAEALAAITRDDPRLRLGTSASTEWTLS
jgi:hypothetical protein